MKALRHIRKWMNQLWRYKPAITNVIDSHRWESKMQMWTCLSSRPH